MPRVAGACGIVECMQASAGDRLHVHTNKVGDPDRVALILEVRGDAGAPPYRVRFPDGHESLIFPGIDSVVERSEDNLNATAAVASNPRPEGALEKLAAWARGA